MTFFCRPLYLLIALGLIVILVLELPGIWKTIMGGETADDPDWGKWNLVGLSIVAIIGIAIFLIFAFTHVDGLGTFGC
jgi:hypothetical protein